MRHGECKTVGSKLVAVTVSVDDDGTAQSCHISGDFFIESVSDAESHALLHDLERALISDDSLRSVLDAHPSCQIIGTDEIAIKTAYSRAVSSNLPPLAGAPAQRVGVGSPDAPNIPASINAQTKQPDKSSEYRERWNALKPQLTVIHDHPRTPDEQMAIDETWAREVAAGTRQPTIRLWEWAGPAVVIGRFQSAQDEVNLDIAKQLGFDVVRPGGTFYIFPKALEDDAVAFCMKAKDYDLILVPSDSFGVPGYFRMAYCIDTEKVERSIAAFEKFVHEVYDR